MKNFRSSTLRVLLLACCITAVPAASRIALAQSSSTNPSGTTTTAPKKATANEKPSIKSQAKDIHKQLQAQVDLLQKQLQQLQQLQKNIQSIKADAEQAKADIFFVRQNDVGMRLNVSHPLAIEYKGVSIAPGGYLAAETALRRGATGGGIGTPYTAIPFSKSALGQQSEFAATAQQSRITLAAEGKYNTATIGGYYETDFLGTGPSSNANESNSYNLRLRQVWARYQNVNGLTVVGGQMWSLLTENTVGMENRYEAIPYTIDANYAPGFIWTRQYAIRIYQNMFGKKMFVGLALENPQTTFAGQGFSNNFVLGTAGNPGGQLNPLTNYSLNIAPDVIAKVAFEPGFGHYEVAGIATFLRDRVYPNASPVNPASAVGAYNDDKVAGGIEAAAWLPFHKGLYNIGIRGLYGQSMGRYGAGGLPDSTVHPDGTLAPLHNVVGMLSAEIHPGKWDIYDYYGGDYAGRAAYINAAGKPVGYGSPLFNNSGCETETVPSSSPYGPGSQANCANDTRAIVNETIGFWYNFYRGDKGRMVAGIQYNYTQRKIWSGIGGDPTANDPMLFTSLRYYIP